MAGVAGPMLRRTRSGGTRFLLGLAVGGAAGGVALAIPAYLLGRVVHAVLPEPVRLGMLAAICAALAVADMADRTPHVWRQVPQRLVHDLPPGTLGLVWGFDLALLFTTQKVASLIWAALAAVVLVDPGTAGLVLVGVAALASVAVMAWSVSEITASKPVTRGERQWVRRIRLASGATLLAMVAVTATQAWAS